MKLISTDRGCPHRGQYHCRR